jgi:3-hydroxybutyrate dehydrogenase
MEADMMSTLTSAGLARGGAPRALDGKVALITGSTEGRGLAIAAGLAAHGAMIALAGPGDPVAVRNLCQSLGANFDVPVWHDDADMSDAAALMDMVERIERGLGSVDILVSQGDQRSSAPMATDWAADPMRGLTMYFHATAAVLPGMRRRGLGHIINLAPAIDLSGPDAEERLRTIRDILMRLTDTTLRRVGDHGITCHALFPGGNPPAPPPPPPAAADAPSMSASALVELIASLSGSAAVAEPDTARTGEPPENGSDRS